ncbi:MAG TPA: pyridoxal 5'-phosphate synthase, partial [Actinomycetes bacterium]|nr:pyridoxal 5'-phosphate synthase [Actinomycetes bacterium]
MRSEYAREALAEADVDADPVVQFGRWFEQAEQAGLLEPTAMTLATATPDGRPSARMVLLRGFDERGFCFYTNYESRKGAELAANPQAALVFWWGELERQVRIEGRVAPTSRADSEAYFHSRPPGSQLSAAASPQSRVIDG